MPKALLLILISILFVTCKKDNNETDRNPICEKQSLLLGKWKFVSRKVTDFKTGAPSTPATNVTVNFDSESYIEFRSNNTFSWYEVYNNKVFRDQTGTTLCVPENEFWIYSDQSKGRLIAESIEELTANKLVFTNIVYTANEIESQIVKVELSK